MTVIVFVVILVVDTLHCNGIEFPMNLSNMLVFFIRNDKAFCKRDRFGVIRLTK